MKKKRKKKSGLTRILEYILAYAVVKVSGVMPLWCGRIISSFFGNILYFLVSKRRNIAIENLRHAFDGAKREEEIRYIARRSCYSFIRTYFEIAKFHSILTRPDAMDKIKHTAEGLDILFEKAKKIHDESGGCIFVTPHIGNWEALPFISSIVGIPLVVVVRPLDNIYLENLLYAHRASSGQVIVPKKNALFVLQDTLRQGKSIGMLPDQSTMKGIPVDFFGRKATTTPVPAILGIMYKRPIVVVACCRMADNYHYEGFVSDPIWPGEYESEKEEVFRITAEMNRKMEVIIRKYPEQYLWIHKRWKTYSRSKKELFI